MTMITLKLNNEKKVLKTPCPLRHALEQWEFINGSIAVAINGEFVPRSHYDERLLKANDCIDVVAPIQGG